MTGESTFQKQTAEILARANKQELIALILRQNEVEQQLLQQKQEADLKTAVLLANIEQRKKEYEELKGLYEELQEKHLILEGQHVLLKNKYFGKSRKKVPSAAARDKIKKGKKGKKPARKLPSERYPDAPVIERHVELAENPNCSCCEFEMTDSGMTEESEYLSVVPAQFFIIRVIRHKYRCGKCHGDIKTAPVPPRIQPRSVLGDELIADVALSKYCDLIPIERYSSIAGRQGLSDLPPQILHEATHSFADFVSGAYKLTRLDVLSSRCLHADETPHKMLEGDTKKNWRLWGFLNKKGVYFEIRNTRSGDVASKLLVDSQCEYLSSDVFSGYGKAVRETNKIRKERGLPIIQCVYCNAHVVRKFKEANELFKQQEIADPDCEWFIARYKEIYDLNEQSQCRHPEEVMVLRRRMVPLFEQMKARTEQLQDTYPSKSAFAKAMQYFLNNYEGFVLFTTDPELEIDNNVMERRLRNPVIGRKTWLGTHSKRGALTAAILFTLVESCKLLGINPREYFKALIQDLHQGKAPYSPAQYQESKNSKAS